MTSSNERHHPFRPIEVTFIRLLAEGWSVYEAAKHMGYAASTGSSWAQRMRERCHGALTNEQMMFISARRWPALFTGIITNHGSKAGYNAHIQLKVPICDHCREAAKLDKGKRRNADQDQIPPT